MDFISYLESIEQDKSPNTPEACFIEEAREDDFFETARTWREIEIHLVLAQSSLESIEAGKHIWTEYTRLQ